MYTHSTELYVVAKGKFFCLIGLLFFLVLDYTTGPSVKNSASDVCSAKTGTLEWATEQCDNDVNCNWLHDYGCDVKHWRFCSNVDIDDYKGNGGCSKIKPGNKSNLNISCF